MVDSKEAPRGPAPPFFARFGGYLLPLLALLAYLGWSLAGPSSPTGPRVSYSAFQDFVDADKVRTIEIAGQAVKGEFRKETQVEGKAVTLFNTTLPPLDDPTLLPRLREKKVEVKVVTDEPSLALYTLLNVVVPFVLVVVFLSWMSRRSAKMMGGPFAGMMKGRVRRFEKEAQVPVKFSDVAGQRGAKRDLEEIVQFLKEPEKFRRLGGKVPRGVLLVGPPGTGKTLLARAVAGEAGVPFFSINGSEFIEMFVGVGASRVRELFEEAKKVAPTIVFIDEIDAVGRARGAGLGGGHDEREQTLNQLLSEMDGFARNDLVIVMAATNRPDVLDSALLRPGRFDRRVVVDRPELESRRAILAVHTRDKPLAEDADLGLVARETAGFSGADLANLCNEAALSATRRGMDGIHALDFRLAYDKIVLGEFLDAKLTPGEKIRVAVHEGGHAVVAHFSPHTEPLTRVTIIPRGMALGVTQYAAEDERFTSTRPELAERLRVLMGGYAAERVFLGETSSGAQNDLKRASEIAFRMVAHFGMSDAIGPVYHEHRTEHPFLGQTLGTEGGTSDRTVRAIEEETRRLLVQAAEEAGKVIEENRDKLEALRDRLLEVETLEKAELMAILGPSFKVNAVVSAEPPA